jgi:transaldolase
MSNPLVKLSEAGVSIWLDDLSKTRIESGNLAELIATKNIVGVTTNPAIFAAAISKGDSYAPQVAALAARGADVDATIRELTTNDVRNAADIFNDVYVSSKGVDGRVSIEVDPRISADEEATVAQAKELWKIVDRPNVLIKIPATLGSLPAITRTLGEGISVNVTLIFSVERYEKVIEAFFAGLELAKQNGHDLSKIHSVASFFVSRVDTEIDNRLKAIGTPDALALLGEAGIANVKLAYGLYEDLFATDRWKVLAAAGANAQRPLWASTGVKDKAYSDTRYVDQIAEQGTVNTMPEATLNATFDHGVVDGTKLAGTKAVGQEIFDGLTNVGVDLDDVFAVLETEGVQKFEQAWVELIALVQTQLDSNK